MKLRFLYKTRRLSVRQVVVVNYSDADGLQRKRNKEISGEGDGPFCSPLATALHAPMND